MNTANILHTIAEGAIIAARENPENARQVTDIDIISHDPITLPETGETIYRTLVHVAVGRPHFELTIDSTKGGEFMGFTPEVHGGNPLGGQSTAAYAIDAACEELARIN